MIIKGISSYKNWIFGLLLGLGFWGYSQESIQFLDAGGGYEEDGYIARIAYSNLYGKHLLTLGGQVHFEEYTVGVVTTQELKAQLYLLNIEYHYEILNIQGRDWVLYLGGGAVLGYEDIDPITLSIGNMLNQESNFIYGGQAGVTLEKYLFSLSPNTTVSLWINARQNYWVNSVFGDSQFNAMAGFRFLF